MYTSEWLTNKKITKLIVSLDYIFNITYLVYSKVIFQTKMCLLEKIQ